MISICGCSVDPDGLLAELDIRLRKTFAGQEDHAVQILSSEKGLLFEIATAIPKGKIIHSDTHVVKETVVEFIQQLMELDSSELVNDCFTTIERVLVENDKSTDIVRTHLVDESHCLISYSDLLVLFVKAPVGHPSAIN